MPWSCTGFDHITFTNIDDVILHQQAFPDHIVDEKPEPTTVGMSDFGYVVLRGPDGKIKDVVGLN